MNLAHLRIVNCSRVADIDIDVRDNMVLIGPNGSGKSTVLLCLDMLLGMDDQQLTCAFSEQLIRDKSQPMTIEATLSTDNSAAETRIDAHLENGKVEVARTLSSSKSEEVIISWTLLKDAAGDTNSPSELVLEAFEHSDGLRAMRGMTACSQQHGGQGVLAIDEPETHLHPTSQRSLVKMLKANARQLILVTNSPTIAGAFEPDEIVVMRMDGSAAQPREHFLSGNVGMLARWWIGRQLEPLTARAVIAVEGPSDRVIVDKVASAMGFDLDRHDIALVETNGCGDMKVVESIFGKGGFGIPLFELIDEDASDEAAKRLDVPEDALETRNVYVSTNDLEDEYVRAIGARRFWNKLIADRVFSRTVLGLCETGPDGYPAEQDLAQFIREKSNRKIPAALAAAELIDKDNAHAVESVAKLLNAAASQ